MAKDSGITRAPGGKAAKYFKAIGRSVDGKELGDGHGITLRPREKRHRPFGDSLLANMNVLSRLGFINELALQDESQRLFCSCVRAGEGFGILVDFEGVVVVTPVGLVGRTALGVTPNTVFEHCIPDESATRLGSSRVLTDFRWIQDSGVVHG